MKDAILDANGITVWINFFKLTSMFHLNWLCRTENIAMVKCKSFMAKSSQNKHLVTEVYLNNRLISILVPMSMWTTKSMYGEGNAIFILHTDSNDWCYLRWTVINSPDSRSAFSLICTKWWVTVIQTENQPANVSGKVTTTTWNLWMHV